MRFSIRDLLWVTALVGMGLGWWMSYRAMDGERIAAVQQTERHRAALMAEKESLALVNRLLDGELMGLRFPSRLGDAIVELSRERDWTVLDEPLVEP